MRGRNRNIILIIVSLVSLLAIVVAGCYHKTPEQRAEGMVKHLVATLNLDADQTAKLEKIKEEFLAKRPDMMKMREETYNDVKEMMLSPQLDQEKLKARTEKIQAQTSDMIQFISTKIVELHDMLTPEQRKKLVEQMEKHVQRHHHW